MRMMKLNEKKLIAAIVLAASVAFSVGCGGGLSPQETTVTEDTTISMPDLVGKTESDAKTEYPLFTFVVAHDYSSKYDEGEIMKQSVKSGEIVEKDAEITITVSKGMKMVEIENFKNYTLDDAKNILESSGFICSVVETQDSKVPAGFVISTDPEAHTTVTVGTSVTIYVSAGASSVTEETIAEVPDFTGSTAEEAFDLGDKAGVAIKISYEYSDEVAKGIVVRQSVEKGTEVEKDTIVEIIISDGKQPLASTTLSPKIVDGANGLFKFEYYIDGIKQALLTEIRDVSMSKAITWNVNGENTVLYKITVTSQETGKSASFAEYKVDFTVNPPKQVMLQYKADIFTELQQDGNAE